MKWWKKEKAGAAALVDKKEEKEAAETPIEADISAVGQETAAAKEIVQARDVPSGPLMNVQGVVRTFQVGGKPLHVLKGIHMQVQYQQLVMLRGRSGSGKTTLLNMLGGLDQPTEGEIWFDDKPFHKLGDDKRTIVRRKDMALSFRLLP